MRDELKNIYPPLSPIDDLAGFCFDLQLFAAEDEGGPRSRPRRNCERRARRGRSPRPRS
jgi:hypothetical protein